MAFKEDYKDEIADRKYQLIDDRTGAVIYPEVKMERVDTPTQVGDKFGSKILNSIFNFMNGLLSGAVTVKNANNAPTGFNVGDGDNLLKVLQFWVEKNKKIQFRPNADGSFNIELKEADGTLIKKLMSVSANGFINAYLNWGNISGKPSTYTPSSHSHAFSEITGKPSTYAPTLGETSTTAYRGDKGKLNTTDIANIKSGTTAVGNANKFGGQLPAYYAKASQFNSISKIRYYGVTLNPAGNNYFDIGNNTNERLIPLYANSQGVIITGVQYATKSTRFILRDNVSFSFSFYYMIVYV